MKKIKNILAILILFLITVNFASSVSLSQLYLMAEDGTFLGTFENEYSSKSIYNSYGNYGSPYASKSIMNEYGTYGSDYSQYSPFNAYSSKGPLLVDKYGNSYGRVSINRYAPGVTEQTYELAVQLKALRDSL